ncbi:Dephospho-CoA kinase cab5 [Hypoxylon texense]
MPPNSFCEWMIGRNVVRKKAPKKPRPVFSMALETDDESEQDTLKLTYPRTGRSRGTKRATRSKKVHFKESARNAGLEHAIAQLPVDSDPQVSSEPEISPDESTTDDDLIMDCPCTNCISARRKLKKSKQAKARSKKYLTDTSTDEDEGSPASVHAKHKAKKAKEAEAHKSKGKKSKSQAKKTKAKSESEAETTDATDAETGPETGADTGASTEGATSGGDTTEAQTTEAETTGGETEAESEKEAPKDMGKKKGKGKQGKQDGTSVEKSEQVKKDKKSSPNGQSNSDEQDTQRSEKNEENPTTKGPSHESKLLSVPETAALLNQARQTRPKVKVNSKSKSFSPHNPPPEMRQANFFMPPRPHVVQVEHAVEVQEDPRPNAFFDNANGVMRVYHGPVYGNPYGVLYPNRVYGNQSLPSPIGTPHPMQNPGYNGFPASPERHGAASRETIRKSASPQAPPATTTSGATGADQWLQGYGSVTIGQPSDESQADQKHPASTKRQSSPTSELSKKTQKDINTESNVLPSIEVTSPEKAQGSNGNRSKPGDIQSAHGSPTGSASKDEKNGRSKHGERKNDGNKRSPDKAKSPKEPFDNLDTLMANDESALKSSYERSSQSSNSGSKENSPAVQEIPATPVHGNTENENTWSPQDEKLIEKAAAARSNFWGENDNAATSSDTQAGNNGAGWSNGNDGASEWKASEWDGGNNSGGNSATDAPDSVGGSANASEQAGGGSDSPDNVLGGNDGSTGSVEEEKKSKEEESKEEKKSKENKSNNEDSHQYVYSSKNHEPPGAWVSPTKSDFSYTELPSRASPDNVGGNWSGSNNGSNTGSNDGTTTGKSTSGGDDDWADESKSNGAGATWGDNTVAQTSGGAFDNDEGFWNDDNAEANNDNIQW